MIGRGAEFAVRTLARPVAVAARFSRMGLRLTRALPLRVRVAVVDALEGRSLYRDRIALVERGIRLELDSSDDLGRRVLCNAYEVEELALLPTLVAPDDVCIDVGANVGLYTTALANLVGPDGRVLAFEADARNVEHLRRNVELNNFDSRVSIYDVAVMDKRGTVEFNLRALGYSGHGSVHRYEGHLTSVSVPAVALDTVLAEQGITEVALLKVDVEGADMDVYAGARQALGRKAFRYILAEWNGFWFPGLGWSVERFLSFFAEFGYHPVDPGLRPWVRLMEDPVGRESWVVNVLLERT